MVRLRTGTTSGLRSALTSRPRGAPERAWPTSRGQPSRCPAAGATVPLSLKEGPQYRMPLEREEAVGHLLEAVVVEAGAAELQPERPVPQQSVRGRGGDVGQRYGRKDTNRRVSAGRARKAAAGGAPRAGTARRQQGHEPELGALPRADQAWQQPPQASGEVGVAPYGMSVTQSAQHKGRCGAQSLSFGPSASRQSDWECPPRSSPLTLAMCPRGGSRSRACH